MMDLLGSENVDVLRRFACSNVLIGFDYDGTLAPIVQNPDEAYMRPRTRDLLMQVARRYPCVVISGRARTDVSRYLEGIGIREVVGNHGLESNSDQGEGAGLVRRWLPLLIARLSNIQGVSIEDKGLSLAIHYRQSPDHQATVKTIQSALTELVDARVIGGKMVFNVLPEGSADKGSALLGARAQAGAETAIYLGDDDTDEDVFALNDPAHLLDVRVERSETSQARYFIQAQDHIDTLLEIVLTCR